MDHDFNNHTDEGAHPRPTWKFGIEHAGNDWEKRPQAIANHRTEDDHTSENPDASPIRWSWDGGDTKMDVGFYVISNDPDHFAYVRHYYSHNGPYTQECKAMRPYYSKVYLDRADIDGQPGWYFDTLVRHELGHVFGLCEGSAANQSEFKNSVMYTPNWRNITGDRQDATDVRADVQWSAEPPSAAYDYGYSGCSVFRGVRCVFGR